MDLQDEVDGERRNAGKGGKVGIRTGQKERTRVVVGCKSQRKKKERDENNEKRWKVAVGGRGGRLRGAGPGAWGRGDKREEPYGRFRVGKGEAGARCGVTGQGRAGI